MNTKPFFLFIILFTLCLTSSSQSSRPSLGIKAGGNLASFTPKTPFAGLDDVRYESKFGYYAGLLLNFEISYNIKLQTEVLYGSQGARFVSENIMIFDPDANFVEGNFEAIINESTLIIPIVIQYYISDKFYLEGGPQFGYILNTTERALENPITDILGLSSDARDIEDFDAYDFGLTFGLGYDISDRVSLNSRYFFGLIKRNDAIKSSVFNLGVNYKFAEL